MKVNMKLSHIFEDESIDYQIGKGFDEKLKNFLEGQSHLQLLNNYISDVEVKNPLGSSILHFDIEPLFKITDLSHQDIKDLQLLSNQSYSDYDPIDYYVIFSDFEEGYGLWSYINNENINLLNKIRERLSPDEELDFLDTNSTSDLNLKLLHLFPDEMKQLINEYSYYLNESMIKSLRKEVSEILEDVWYDSKFRFKYPYEEMQITAAELYMNIIMNESYGSLMDLLFVLLGNKFDGLIDIFADIYKYEDEENFDKINFNKFANQQLKKIVDILYTIKLWK